MYQLVQEDHMFIIIIIQEYLLHLVIQENQQNLEYQAHLADLVNLVIQEGQVYPVNPVFHREHLQVLHPLVQAHIIIIQDVRVDQATQEDQEDQADLENQVIPANQAIQEDQDGQVDRLSHIIQVTQAVQGNQEYQPDQENQENQQNQAGQVYQEDQASLAIRVDQASLQEHHLV